jgi:hypothetical protein
MTDRDMSFGINWDEPTRAIEPVLEHAWSWPGP